MSNIVLQKLLENVGPTKHTQQGWTSFDGKCCIHNGDRRNDTRKRAGVRMTEGDGFVYHCFNCHFTTGWVPGSRLGNKVKKLLSWFSVPDDDIKKIKFKAYQMKAAMESNMPLQELKKDEESHVFLSFKEINLPAKSKSLDECFETETNNKNFLNVIEYLLTRGDYLSECGDYYWADSNEHSLKHRLIIPFKWNGRIVGWTARYAGDHKFKYMSELPPDYLFNTESIKPDNEAILVCEGPFDALAINGVATLGDKMSSKQIQWLKQQNKKIIIVPDREKQGGKLVDIAIANNWSVSFPEWDSNIKDCAQASKEYGVLYTVWSLLNSVVDSVTSIRTKRTKLRSKNGRR